MMTKEVGEALIDWVPINERIIKARFFFKHIKLTMIHTYAPIEGTDEQIKDEFYEKSQETIQQVNKHDLLIVTGDMNAKVSNDNENYEQVIGKQGIGTRNKNGPRLCEIYDMNDLVITGTIFPHRHIHLATWKSPDGTTLNQIDHTLVNKRFRNSVLDTRVMRSADTGSDHYLVRTTVKLKLKRTPKVKDDNSRIRFDTDKLKQEVFRSRFAVTVRNKFEILEDEVMEGESDQIEECYRIEKCYTETAKEVLGKKKRKKKPWISEQSWALIEQRNNLHKKIVGTRDLRE